MRERVTSRRANVRVGWCVVIALVALTACGGDDSGSDDVTKIRVSVQPTTTALPVAVADELGFFEERGLEVEWTVSNVPISDAVATLGRQVDVTMGTQPTLITAAAEGVPVVVVSGGARDTVDNPTAGIVASKESGVASYADLEGKTVGTLTLTGNIHFSLLKAMQDAGVDLDSIDWVVGTVPTLPDMLKSGRVDAIEEIEPFATRAVQDGGVLLGDPFRAVADEAYVGLWLADSAWANENQETALAFNEAMHEAAEWIADEANEAEAKELQSSYTGLEGEALANTPIPDFAFVTSAEELRESQEDDLAMWIDLLRETSDYSGTVEPLDLLPTWASQ